MQMLIKRIKAINLNNRSAFLPLVMLGLALVFGNAGCGKRGAPLPPIEPIPQRVVISGIQRGNQVNLSWQMPARNAPDGSVLNIDRVEVYRLAERADSPLVLNEDEFASQSTQIASVPVEKTDFSRKILTYTDTLELAGQPVRLRYAIRFVNESGQKANFSNFLLLEPTAKVAKAPTAITVEITEPALIVRWQGATENVDGSKPANVLGYNIYRTTNDAPAPTLLNKAPVTQDVFSDGFFEFGSKYTYIVRTVSLGGNGQPVESLDSKAAEISPKDVYPPSSPGSITIAASPNTVSIFYAVNPEKDIAGYRIYRTENQNQPKSEWKLISPATFNNNTFQDKTVESGKTYYYYLTAVDKFGNVSEPSEVVSETVP